MFLATTRIVKVRDSRSSVKKPCTDVIGSNSVAMWGTFLLAFWKGLRNWNGSKWRLNFCLYVLSRALVEKIHKTDNGTQHVCICLSTRIERTKREEMRKTSFFVIRKQRKVVDLGKIEVFLACRILNAIIWAMGLSSRKS